jgi:hypothetical protein
LPASRDAYQWVNELTGSQAFGAAASAAIPGAPAVSTLECLIREVTCIDETSGFCGTEAGADEIRMGGEKVDPRARVTRIPGFKIKDFEEDGDTKTYPPPNYKRGGSASF